MFVMIIDDSPTIRRILEICLRREGYEAISFPDGVAALSWLRRAAAGAARLPDLIFLDIGMPKMDGYDVAHQLKATPQYSQIVIVMLSGRDGILDRIKGRLVGAKEYLTKPVTTQRVLAVVQTYLGVV